MTRINVVTKKQHRELYKSFSITSVCRADLIQSEAINELTALSITDYQMKMIASKMEEAYTENMFWESLRIISKSVLEQK
jgi:hypothetical protein